MPRLRPGTVLIGFLAPLTAPETVADLRAAGVHGFAMEAVPRISRAQSMDALSSQANVDGYRSVLVAAEYFTRYFPMLTTAAGTVKPATVLVLGVGVAGLQALATAKRLGARTTGYDVRPEVAEQVRSLGAQWLDLGIELRRGRVRPRADRGRADGAAEAPGGGDHRVRRGDHHRERAGTTGADPGDRRGRRRDAPRQCGRRPRGGERRQLRAHDAGGDVVHHDVTVTSPLNLPATMPEHASELYARNVVALLELMLDDAGALVPERITGGDDEVLVGSCVTREGRT